MADAAHDLRHAVQLHSCQTLTPESATTTHYFFQQAYQADTPDAGVTAGIYRSLIAAFNEDREMITAQHRNLVRDPGAPMLPLYMDSALMQFRRLVEAEAGIEAGSQGGA